MGERAAALAVAVALDLVFGDVESRWHPVALVGRLLHVAYRPWRSRPRGVQLAGGALSLGTVVTLVAALSWAGGRLARQSMARTLVLAAMLKPTFAIRSLLQEGSGVACALEQRRLSDARRRLRALVSRPTDSLDAGLAASAAIESIAENLGDSIAAPLLYYCLFGVPGAAMYRVVNTADAMVGYRGDTEWLGKSAARLDDALSWIPSRVAAACVVIAARLLHGQAAASRSWAIWRRDRHRTASPNAGESMAAMAGALGRRLEKPRSYVLGSEFPQPGPDDVRQAVRLGASAAALLTALATLAGAVG